VAGASRPVPAQPGHEQSLQLTPQHRGAASATADPIPDVVTASVVTSVPVVYPHKDGYRDTVKITATALTADSSVSTSPGTIVITKGTKVVKTWKISAAAPVNESWTGLVKSKISTGTYVVTVTYTNADSTTATSHASVGVSAKKLVARHWTKKVTAESSSTSCGFCSPDLIVVQAGPPTHSGGVTHFHYKSVTAMRLQGGPAPLDPNAEFAAFTIAIPAGVSASVKNAREYVTAHPDLGGAHGHKFLLAACGADSSYGFGACGTVKTLKSSGSVTSPSTSLAMGSTTAGWVATVSANAVAVVYTFTVHVTYYGLK
jgi:hypothetical protein